jgi:hypothetical protein
LGDEMPICLQVHDVKISLAYDQFLVMFHCV